MRRIVNGEKDFNRLQLIPLYFSSSGWFVMLIASIGTGWPGGSTTK